jgi:hypothetical protein
LGAELVDIVAITNALKPVTDWAAENWQLLAVSLCAYAFYLWSRGFWRRLFQIVEKIAFSNWQLALLGSTAVVLSLASGWTTWDGMRNFTNEPVLSLMITFGIQGVMLIVAWLIGESFASGMNVERSRDGPKSGFSENGLEWIAGALLGIIVVFGSIVLVVQAQQSQTPLFSSDQLLFAIVAIAAVALIAFLQGDLLRPYIQSSKIILRNAVLWVMFLSCMLTSVFFSFDSLFSAIFPQEERARAAHLRAQNQVAGLMADIGQTIEARRMHEAEALFSSEGWRKYQEELDRLAGLAQGAQIAIEEYFVAQLEAGRRAIAEQQERRASAQSQQSGLKTKAVQLNEEIARLQAQRPEAAAAVDQQRQVVAEIQRRLDEQRARSLAEEKGVEGTGLVGRGRQWREERSAESRIEAELQVANKRLEAPLKQVNAIDERVASIKSELSQIEGQLAQLRGEAETAEQRIRAAENSLASEESGVKVDPARVLPAFERAKVAFRQEPTAERLTALQQQCTHLLNAMTATPKTKESVRDIDCDPNSASEAAAFIFALNSGSKAFQERCAGGERLEKVGSTDGLFAFARKCLADSRLSSADTDALRSQINLAELNRDDKAHRFVVTWNAFNDGNRLAYLALAIAIAIDALVFMSGLFGANAVRSPLQDVPRHKPRTAQQLEAIIDTALQPNTYESAHAVIEAMHPIPTERGFTQEVILPAEATAQRAAITKVLNAGATIGAVTRDEFVPYRYLVRPELFEYLSIVARQQYETNQEHRRLAELKRLMMVALQPNVGEQAAVVLHNMHPINEHDGFTSEVLFDEIDPHHVPIVKRALNAASVLNYVARDTRSGEEDRFYVHKDLYKTLAALWAATPVSGTWLDQASRPGQPALESRMGGSLSSPKGQVGAAVTARLPDRTSRTSADTDSEPEAPAYKGDLSESFSNGMLSFVGLEFDDVRSLISSSALKEAAGHLRKALDAQGLDNARLKAEIAEVESLMKKRLDEAYSQIRREIAGDANAKATADEVVDRLALLSPLLILLPKLNLFEHLIVCLRDAALETDDQTNEDQTLLEQLEAVREVLINDDIELPQTWLDAAEQLRDPNDSDQDAEVLPFRNSRGNGSGNA